MVPKISQDLDLPEQGEILTVLKAPNSNTISKGYTWKDLH